MNPGDDIHQSRFPGTVRPDQTQYRATIDPERNVLNGLQPTEVPRNSVEPQQFRHGQTPAS